MTKCAKTCYQPKNHWGPHDKEASYKIVRFKLKGTKRTILNNVSLETARLYCNDPRSQNKEWFDGYEVI